MAAASTIGSSTEILTGELGLSNTGLPIARAIPDRQWRDSPNEEVIPICAMCCNELPGRVRVCPHCDADVPRL